MGYLQRLWVAREPLVVRVEPRRSTERGLSRGDGIPEDGETQASKGHVWTGFDVSVTTMTPKPHQMSKETLDALSEHTFCPICGQTGVKLGVGHLYRIEDDDKMYRKERHLAGTCIKCAEEGRGDVHILVHQRF